MVARLPGVQIPFLSIVDCGCFGQLILYKRQDAFVMPDPNIKLAKAIDAFAEAAIRANEAIYETRRMAVTWADRRIARWEKIASFGDEGRIAAKDLLTHEHPSVRVAAAGYLLRFAHDDARAVLEEAAKHKGIVAFQAQECLKRWEEGEWHLDD